VHYNICDRILAGTAISFVHSRLLDVTCTNACSTYFQNENPDKIGALIFCIWLFYNPGLDYSLQRNILQIIRNIEVIIILFFFQKKRLEKLNGDGKQFQKEVSDMFRCMLGIIIELKFVHGLPSGLA